jgi:magnesium chelatase family protein
VLATVASATLRGVEGLPVRVEVHVSNGLPSFSIVGLPDTACREARDRARAALLSSGLTWPQRKITVNLAPSGVRKVGASLDLAVALGVLVADEQLPATVLEGRAFVGELGLDGAVKPVHGLVPMAMVIAREELVVPDAAVHEAALVGRHQVRGIGHIGALLDVLLGRTPWPAPPPPPVVDAPVPVGDLADVRGQPSGRLAAEVAAAGGHHLLLLGPPGSGKTMLAERLVGLLPDLPRTQALETTLVHSAAGLPVPGQGLIVRPPMRAPHHSASAVALVGGGAASLRPGEISLAHHGVLFLDELGEFPTHVLEMLRQPLESGHVVVARASGNYRFPARFLLVAAMNPCPCGEALRPGACRCGDGARMRYARRLSGPLLDRFDLRVIVQRPPAGLVLSGPGEEASSAVADRVRCAREQATARGVAANAELRGRNLDAAAPLCCDAKRLLEAGLERGQLTARGVQRVRAVALTVADLGGREPPLTADDVATALALRAEPRLGGGVGL